MIPLVGRVVGAAHPAQGPEHTAVDLIAHLHDIRQRSGLLELGHDSGGVGLDLLLERVEGQAGPGGWRGLVARIGPRVGVMEVEQEHRPGRLDSTGHTQGVREVVDLHVRVIGVHEEAQPESVGAVRPEDRDGVTGLTAALEHAAGPLDPLQRRDVGAQEHRGRGPSVRRWRVGWGASAAGQQGERQLTRVLVHHRAGGITSGALPRTTHTLTLAGRRPSASAVRRSSPGCAARRIASPRPLNA
jgi:hypothetical protein